MWYNVTMNSVSQIDEICDDFYLLTYTMRCAKIINNKNSGQFNFTTNSGKLCIKKYEICAEMKFKQRRGYVEAVVECSANADNSVENHR